MKRYIKNAEEPISKEDKLKDAIGTLQDDFSFAIDGISKLSADGNTDKALELVNSLSEMINASIEEMAENIASEE